MQQSLAYERIQLRPYQAAAIAGLRAEIAAGRARPLLVAPTGSGKTVIASSIIHSCVGRGFRVVFLAHRKELIDQTVEKLGRYGVSAGVIMANDARRDDWQPVQVCSVQTLARRLDRRPHADLVIVDEAHHANSDTYRAIFGAYPDATTIGLTATPWRNDKRGLRDIFDSIVVAATPAELMASGALVEYDAFAYDSPDLHKVKITAGEYNQRDLGIACNTNVLVGNVVGEYIRHAAPRRVIVFPVNVEHSEHLVQEFRAAGFAAEHVDAYTPKLQRERAMERFRRGDLTVLSSVGVLIEGFDAPAAEVCLLARPTKSLTLHLQMIGRVLRPSPDTGKQRALIHDHSGNLLRLGLPEEPREYALTSTPKREIELHTCPMCCNIFGAVRKDGTCPKCGMLIAPPTDQCKTCGRSKSTFAAADDRCTCETIGFGAREKLVVAGVRISRETIASIRERREHLNLRNDLTDEQLVRAHNATMEEKAAEYLRLCKVRDARGFQKGFVGHQFRNTFGFWPQFKPHQLEGVEPAAKPFLPLPPRNKEQAA